MARRATKKQMTIDELKAFLSSQSYRGKLVDTGILIVKTKNDSVPSYQNRKVGSGVSVKEHDNTI